MRHNDTIASDRSPSCPACGSAMRARSGKYGQFYGCSAYPRCKKTIPIPRVKASAPAPEPTGAAPGWLDNLIAPIVGSEEQCAVWERILVPDGGHIVVNALAGCGKSFTAAHGIKLIKNVDPSARILYLCFNKSISLEFSGKYGQVAIEDNAHSLAQVSTLNSFGHGILTAHYRAAGINARLDNYKTSMIVNEIIPENFDPDKRDSVIASVAKLADLCRAFLYSGTDSELEGLAARFDLDIPDNPDWIREALHRARNYSKNGSVIFDFADQLWLPIMLNLAFPKYDYVMIDEAQDLSPVQHEMVARLASKGARVIVIGDKHQAIYGFRGADTRSIENLSIRLEASQQVETLGLTYTRRCPKSVVALVNRLYPGIGLKALPDAPEGFVDEHAPKSAFMEEVKPHDMVLSRTNAPLVSLAFALIRAQKPVYIMGRDIGANIIKTIENLRARSVPDLIDKATAWAEREIEGISRRAAKGGRKPSGYAIQAAHDKADCIVEIARGIKEKNPRAGINQVIDAIKGLFADADDKGKPANAIVLSSVHKSKGLEADTIHVWTPELFPHPMASTAEEIEQEHNCHYVALTRSANRLLIYS